MGWGAVADGGVGLMGWERRGGWERREGAAERRGVYYVGKDAEGIGRGCFAVYVMTFYDGLVITGGMITGGK